MFSEIERPAPEFEHKTIFMKLFLDPHVMCNSFSSKAMPVQVLRKHFDTKRRLFHNERASLLHSSHRVVVVHTNISGG